MDGRFQGLFHSPARGASHLSLTVLVRYRSSGRIQPCGMVPADSARVPRVPAYSGIPTGGYILRVRECHPLRRAFPDASTSMSPPMCRNPTTPDGPKAARFGLIPFRSPLLGESTFLSSPAGTEMFQFPALAPGITPGDGTSSRRVAPFGHARISSCLPIPALFRGLPRPSSPPEAKASSVRPPFLPLQ